MPRYYVNVHSQSNGDHEVHKEGCSWFPSNREFLGNYDSCYPAVTEARIKGYIKANGCYHCSRACHTS